MTRFREEPRSGWTMTRFMEEPRSGWSECHVRWLDWSLDSQRSISVNGGVIVTKLREELSMTSEIDALKCNISMSCDSCVALHDELAIAKVEIDNITSLNKTERDSCTKIIAEKEKINLAYVSCVDQLEKAKAEINKFKAGSYNMCSLIAIANDVLTSCNHDKLHMNDIPSTVKEIKPVISKPSISTREKYTCSFLEKMDTWLVFVLNLQENRKRIEIVNLQNQGGKGHIFLQIRSRQQLDRLFYVGQTCIMGWLDHV
uniref:Uncharacterized protein n=1 Tax=Oryza brachyantha TaxID=4533 RepID=J3L0M0_ORYBR